jgi:hypothetical protein
MRYEDIRIGHGIAALHAALSQPATTTTPTIPGTDDAISTARPPRRRVRRAVLPYALTATPTRDAPPALALLALLPHLEVLVRPPLPSGRPPIASASSSSSSSGGATPFSSPIHFFAPPRFEFPTAAPALPALRRLEWAFDQTGDAARAGGINALNDVLGVAAPSLQELVLTSSMPLAALRQRRLHLPALRTLRLCAGAGMCPLLVRQTTYWVLPMLENVVVEGPAARAEALEALWEKFEGQVRVLELEVGGLSMGDVGKIVGVCPALEELNLRLDVEDLDPSSCWNSTIDPDDDDMVRTSWACTHNTLRRVGICVDAGQWSVKTWMVVTEFVGKMVKEYPALRHVALYVQDSEFSEQNSQFRALRETLSSNGRQLSFAPASRPLKSATYV